MISISVKLRSFFNEEVFDIKCNCGSVDFEKKNHLKRKHFKLAKWYLYYLDGEYCNGLLWIGNN
jgi:hypothetical protein